MWSWAPCSGCPWLSSSRTGWIQRSPPALTTLWFIVRLWFIVYHSFKSPTPCLQFTWVCCRQLGCIPSPDSAKASKTGSVLLSCSEAKMRRAKRVTKNAWGTEENISWGHHRSEMEERNKCLMHAPQGGWRQLHYVAWHPWHKFKAICCVAVSEHKGYGETCESPTWRSSVLAVQPEISELDYGGCRGPDPTDKAHTDGGWQTYFQWNSISS